MRSRPVVADEGNRPERLVVDQLPVVVWTTDADLRFTMSFGGGLAALGLEPGQVVGVSLFEYFGTEDESFPPIAAHRRALSGLAGRFETAWQGRTFEYHVLPQRAEDGPVTGVVGFALDVTEAREAEERLSESEERYRTLVERLPGAVYVAEPGEGGPFFFMGPQIESMTGFSVQAWLDDPDLWLHQLHPDDRERVLANEDRAVARGEGLTGEYRFVCADGSVIWIEDEAQSILDDEGSFLFWGILYDVTERRRAVEDLELAEARYRTLVEQIPAVTYLSVTSPEDPDRLAFEYVSPQLAEVLGYEPSEWIEHPELWAEPLHPDDRERVLAELRRTDATGEPFDLEYRVFARDGRTVWLHDSAVLIARGDRELHWQGLMLDVTADKEAELRIREQADALATRARRQGMLADLGLRAFELEVPDLFDHTVRALAETLDAELCKVLELVPSGDTLRLVAGVGWAPGLVGEALVPAEAGSQAGYTLRVGEPVLVEDLGLERRFTGPALLLDHGVVSGVSCPIELTSGAFGVLGVHDTRRRAFTAEDADFLRSVANVLGSAVDRRRTEAALRTAEERFRMLVEAGPGVVYVNDHGFPPTVTYVSPQVTDLLGYSPEDWIKDPAFWVGRIHREDRKRVLRETESAIRGRKPLVQEYRLVAADGRDVWVQDRATSVIDEDGAPVFRQGLMLDVSARRRAEEERRRALESQLALANRLEAIHELDRSLLSAVSADEMADAALDRLRFLIPCDRASVRFYEPERRTLVLVRAWERDGVHLQIPAEIELADEESVRLMQRELFLVQDLRELGDLPAVLRPLAAAGVRSGIGVPLVSEGEYLGYLTILSVSPGRLDERHADVAREIAAALAIGVRETRLRGALRARADQLAQLAEERRELLRRIVRAQEEERGRVALEIHDGIGQVLTSISLFASDLEQDVRDELRPRAARLSELVRRVISDSRQLVWTLRPPELERLGLVSALLRLVEDASAGGEVEVDLHEDIGELRLAPDTEAVVYRVVQEAVNNAQKHARASSVSVVLRRDAGSIAVVVEDDGRGFDPDAIAPGHGIGLIGMRERAELVDGALVVESRKGGGTRVRLEVPVDAIEGPRDGS